LFDKISLFKTSSNDMIRYGSQSYENGS
jgi:hypothetical protein